MRRITKIRLVLAIFSVITKLLTEHSSSEKVVRTVTLTKVLVGFSDLWLSTSKYGKRVCAVGTTANFLAVLTNNGLMPVQRSKLRKVNKCFHKFHEGCVDLPSGSWIKGTHCAVVDDGKANFNILTGSLLVGPKVFKFVISIGDVFLYVGAFIGIVERLTAFTKKKLASKSVSKSETDFSFA